jgi:hypothetical protein
LSYLWTCWVASHTGTELEASQLEDSGIVALRLIVNSSVGTKTTIWNVDQFDEEATTGGGGLSVGILSSIRIPFPAAPSDPI